MFKVDNKDTRTTPLTSFWCLYFLNWTYFTPCSSVSIVNFEHVIGDWEFSEGGPGTKTGGEIFYGFRVL